MKTNLLMLMLFISTTLTLFSQKTSFETWSRILNSANVEWNEMYSYCPNFPKKNLNAKEFSLSVTNWNNNFPNEVNRFYALEKIVKINPSPYYLGLPTDRHKNKYTNATIQWIKESKISDRRLMEVAPHFPSIDLNESFDFEFKKWQTLYGHEYENLLNAKELIALNPNYKEYVDVVKVPNFIGPLETKEKPVLKENSSKEELLDFELKMMNWIFVFNEKDFLKTYGFVPDFPDFFNVERYKASIVEKIDESERQKQLGNFETH